MTHPLTNERAINLFSWERLMDTSNPLEIEDAMRTAADWQLEQVIEWLAKNAIKHDAYQRFLYFYDDDGTKALVNQLTCDLKKAMRPQEDS